MSSWRDHKKRTKKPEFVQKEELKSKGAMGDRRRTGTGKVKPLLGKKQKKQSEETNAQEKRRKRDNTWETRSNT